VRSKADEIGSLIQRTAQIQKIRKKHNPNSSEETVPAIAQGSLVGKGETTG